MKLKSELIYAAVGGLAILGVGYFVGYEARKHEDTLPAETENSAVAATPVPTFQPPALSPSITEFGESLAKELEANEAVEAVETEAEEAEHVQPELVFEEVQAPELEEETPAQPTYEAPTYRQPSYNQPPQSSRMQTPSAAVRRHNGMDSRRGEREPLVRGRFFSRGRTSSE